MIENLTTRLRKQFGCFSQRYEHGPEILQHVLMGQHPFHNLGAQAKGLMASYFYCVALDAPPEEKAELAGELAAILHARKQELEIPARRLFETTHSREEEAVLVRETGRLGNTIAVLEPLFTNSVACPCEMLDRAMAPHIAAVRRNIVPPHMPEEETRAPVYPVRQPLLLVA